MGERDSASAARRTVESALLDERTRGTVEALLLRRARGAGPKRGAMTPAPRTAPPRASSGQERLWLAGQWSDDAARSYLVYEAFRLRGPLVVDALSAAVTDLVARHEVLRTGFELVGDTLVQRVAHQVPTPFEFVDLSHEDDRERRCQELLAQQSRRVFDLTAPPLLRTLLVRLDTATHVLMVVQHHIVTDGWSLAVLYRELRACYAARLDGRPAKLPALPVQYGDYAAWQQERLRDGLLDDDLAYWRDRLDGAAPLLELPLDRPRRRAAGRGGECTFVLDHDLVERLTRTGRGQDATLFMTMLACFGVVLARHARTDDIVVGSPVAGRTTQDVQDLLGFFVNMLPLRFGVSEEMSFAELLRAVRDVAVDAYAHQEFPFDRLVEVLNTRRDPSFSPIVQVVFALRQNTSASDLFGLSGVDTSVVATPPTPAKFDLTITADEDQHGIRGVCEYNADIFDHATVERLLANWLSVMTAVACREDIPLTGIPTTTRADLDLLRSWGRARTTTNTEAGLIDLFDARVARHPGNVAVEDIDDSLTYRELDRVTDLLATELCARGVTPGDLVGISLPRSRQVVVAILGVLKAGAAYLPLDPAYPTQRLDLMVEDAGPRHVVTSTADAHRFPGLTTVLVDAAAPTAEASDGPPPGGGRRGADLAYVLYTSGSTGRPKGVQIDHRNVVRLIERVGALFDVDHRDTWLLLHSYAFDFSVWEMWGALAYGGRLVVPGADTVRSTAMTVDLIGSARVSVLNCTPALFAELSSEWVARGAPALPGLRHVIFGGAALDRAGVRRWWDAATDGRPTFVNMYGITETTVHVTVKELTEADLRGDTAGTPIGRALDDLDVAVVDDRGRHVPIGVPGELCVAGAGLSRGYLGRDDLTEERFRTDFVEGTTTRYYRSGDLVRWLPTGVLEYLGRDDDQVEVRGFRIELGEVDAALRACDGVDTAVTVARPREAGAAGDVLVGYVTGAGLSGTAVRDRLRAVLPGFMVPSAVVVLDELPRLPNGKVDRRALPAPGRDDTVARTYVAPRNDLESAVAQVWGAVLRRDTVGVHDDFFELGGHSLSVMQIRSRLRERLGVDITTRDVFDAPTVAGLCSALTGKSAPARPGITPVDRTASVLPASSQVTRRVLIQRLHPDSPMLNVSEVFRLRGELTVAALAGAVEDVVARHEVLRTGFDVLDGRVVQRIHDEVPLPWWFVDLSDLPDDLRESRCQELLAAQSRHVFDVATPPLLRALLVRITATEHVLMILQHHVVTDAWSLAVLYRELRECYAARLDGRDPDLPELPVQYADYAVWQHDWFATEDFAAELRYWREHLRTAVPDFLLPFDSPRTGEGPYACATHVFTVDKELLGRLTELADRGGVTVFTVCYAAFVAMLHKRTGRSRITLGTLAAARPSAAIENALGLYANTMILDIALDGGLSFSDMVSTANDVLLNAINHQDVPFDRIALDLPEELALHPSPFCSIAFQMITIDGEPTLDGLSVERLDVWQREYKRELLVSLIPDGDGLTGDVVFASELYRPDTVATFFAEYRDLLARAVDAPHRGLDDLW